MTTNLGITTDLDLYNCLRGEGMAPDQARRIADVAVAEGVLARGHEEIMWDHDNSVRDHLCDRHGIPDAFVPLDNVEARDRHDAHHNEGFEHVGGGGDGDGRGGILDHPARHCTQGCPS